MTCFMRMGNKRPVTSAEKFRKRTQTLRKGVLKKFLRPLHKDELPAKAYSSSKPIQLYKILVHLFYKDS